MDPAEESHTKDDCGGGDVPRRSLGQEMREPRKGSREIEDSDSGREEKRKGAERPPNTIDSELIDTVLEENPQENDSTLDMLVGIQSMLEDLVEMRSLSEDAEQTQELVTLGGSAFDQFGHTGDVEDISRAIEWWQVAAALSEGPHTKSWLILSYLAYAYSSRFRCLGNISDLEDAIDTGMEAVSLAPKNHPNRPVALRTLGNSNWTRFELLGEVSDLSKAIECHEEAVALVPDNHPEKLTHLSNLGASHLARFRRLSQHSDLSKAIEYHTKAVTLASDVHPDKPAICNNLGSAYLTRFRRIEELSDLSKAIEFHEQAVSLTPDRHPDRPTKLHNLGTSYWARFKHLGELSDLNKAVGVQVEAVSLTTDGQPQKPVILNNLGATYWALFQRLGEVSDLNKAIESHAEAVLLAPDGHPNKPGYLINLGNSYMARFQRLAKGPLADLSEAIECQEEAVALTPNGHPDKPAMLNNLGSSCLTRFEHLCELSDLSKAIEFHAESVALIPNGHPSKPAYLHNLGDSYWARFNRLEGLSDLSKAIDFQVEAVSLTPGGSPERPRRLGNLGISYVTRFQRLGGIRDLQSAEESFRIASELPTGPPSIRFDACRYWANLSLLNPLISPFPAYQRAMSLIPQLVWIGTTIGRRYELVTEVSNFVTEAASYAISTGTLDLALEWLEAGRSIVWGQIAQLRTPFESLAAHNSQLAEELARVGHQLELAGSRSSLPPSLDTTEHGPVQEANTHIELALNWGRLLEEIRSMPGFEDFLRSPKAGRLLSVAKTHPVAIINLDNSRCDALILKSGGDTISHIALPHFSSKDALSARSFVLSQVRDRKPGVPLKTPGLLQSSLENLWSGMIGPILDSLGYTHKLPVDQLPHITWCTTGLLSFLPLHTSRSRDESQPGAFDLVISSYTPTLSALLSSKPADLSSPCGILAISQENTPGLTSLPYTTEELAAIRKHAGSEYYLQLENDEATVEQVLDAMDQFSWVHMACHGSQDPYDPTKSAFHLHDGNLTLADITKRPFTNKGLAFLSACQTATGDENMPDEAVHLAAGMLMAGYPSVIGTMWSIADEDGPEVADLVYAELLKDGKMDHTNAAKALHRAVTQLREKVGVECIERWAPFIHIGI